MTENTEWTDELKKQLDSLEAAGVDISDYKGIKTKEEYEAKKNELTRKLEEVKAPEVKAPEAKNAEKTPTDNDKPQSLVVDNEGGDKTDDLQWIEEKRKFWKEYAESVENTFENDAQKDIESKSFHCSLTKDKDHGEATYISPTNVQVSKDSHLVTYQGFVKDALKNNLTITFGPKLDGKQKAMLLAACLMEQGTYGNGNKVAMVNPPKIDMDAEYMKDIPEDAKKVLEGYAKAKQQEAQQKISELKKRLKENDTTEGKTPEEQKNIMKERREIRKEQLAGVKDLLTSKQIATHEQKEIDREKIMAARLGITGAYTTKNAKGEERVAKEEEGLDKAKGSDGKLRIPQYVQKALAEKYGKNQGK